MKNRAYLQKGISLLEVLIAMLVGLILLSGVIQLLINGNQSFRIQSALTRVQENGQYALEYVTRDIRNTDFWGCLSGSGWVTNQLTGGGTGYYNFANGLAGTANQGTGGAIIAGSDTITISSSIPASGLNYVIPPLPVTMSDAVTTNATSSISSGTIVMVADCVQGDIFQVTNANASSGTLQHAAGGTTPGNASNSLSKVYGADAYVYLPYVNMYSIQTGTGALPSLFLTNAAGAQELVEGIENMLILYGEDTDADGSANRYVRADQVTSMSNVVSVRISLVVASLENNILPAITPYTLNGQTITPTDKRLRQVYTTTVNLRNRINA